jgi:signal transduction histidine kinase
MNAITPSDALFFYYHPATGEIPFSSIPPGLFFNALFDARSIPPFREAVNIHDLEYITKEWQSCLQLGKNETRHFSFRHASSDSGLVFDCSALGVDLPVFNGSMGLLIHAKKTAAVAVTPKSAPNLQKDYAEFIELAGHDLDAPLRKISVLMERLVAKIEASGDIAGYIARIQASLSDMRKMLDGLSALSGLSSSDRRSETCDLNEIVGSIIENLPAAIRDHVMITGSLPVLQGDRNQYRQLFEQLIRNALLFSNAGTVPVVEIYAQANNNSGNHPNEKNPEQEFHKIVVKDEGVGFLPEYAEKIFRPFVRLHGKSEYPGHGMGLAIAKRIVENHQGVITAESNTGEGARFTLILPQTIT